jgi:hypothetical protein
MTQPRPSDRDAAPTGASLEPIGDPDEQGDFADEHASPTFAEDVPDGLERSRNESQPKGLAGMD